MNKDAYFKSDKHPITVTVVGAGGNGSQMLTQLGRIHYALQALGMKGLHVNCFDDDLVTEANAGRQLFSPSDVGHNKAAILIGRINRFFGCAWLAFPERITEEKEPHQAFSANIVITCTDNKKSRVAVSYWLKQYLNDDPDKFHDCYKPYAWMDIGNRKDIGQVIMGYDWKDVKIPNLLEMYPKYSETPDDINTPSCSLAEALLHQSLFINTFVTNVAAELLWEFLTEDELLWHGAFVNLKTLNIKKIKCL